MKLICKIKSKRGFSLGELLVATLILLMVSSVVAGGIPVARDAYQKVTIGANSQVLLSTAISELRNELGMASQISEVDDKTLAYISGNTGSISKLCLSSDGITIKEYGFNPLKPDPKDAVGGTALRERVLVPKTTAPDNLYVTYESVTVSSNVVEIKNLAVKRDANVHADQSVVDVRIIR